MRGSDYEVSGKPLWERTASHLMQKDVFFLKETDSCHHLAERIVKENFGSVPVVDREGRLVGIMTEYDLLELLLDGKNLKETPVSEYMTRPAISISEEMTADQITVLLQARHLLRVPVTDRNGILIGMLARRDILAGYLDSTSGLP
ncbi:MAG TPA: CBS domain-containing protein [Candidatus Manganitrophaceae bacterium]|nr:CBS domain-containing protein [Candidatus Manganitrophaceae bacterium]